MPSKTRNMPGFTAEAAVYASGRSYRAVAGTSASHAASGVFLSFAERSRDCIPGCVCATQEGCPCCDSFGSTQRSSVVRVRMQTRTPFEDWCDHAGGGLSSDPDGGVTCTIYV